MPVFKIKQNGEWVDIAGGGGEIPDNLVYVSEENQESAVVPLDADTLGGYTVNSLIDKIYPIGSIYMSVNSVSPNVLFGGTWEALKDRFLIGAGEYTTAGSTGGEATHTLTIDEMPSHSHPQNARVHGYSGWEQFNTGTGYTVNISTSGGNYHSPNTTLNSADVSMSISTSARGGSQPHNNIPPFLSVYMWKRTA